MGGRQRRVQHGRPRWEGRSLPAGRRASGDAGERGRQGRGRRGDEAESEGESVIHTSCASMSLVRRTRHCHVRARHWLVAHVTSLPRQGASLARRTCYVTATSGRETGLPTCYCKVRSRSLICRALVHSTTAYWNNHHRRRATPLTYHPARPHVSEYRPWRRTLLRRGWLRLP